jgi:hypothetical protein
MEDPFLKDYIIKDIIREVESEGFYIEKSNVDNFLDNFVAQYERLPKKKEIGPIVTSYIKLIKAQNENYSIAQGDGNKGSQSDSIDSFMQNFLNKKNLINEINHDKSLYNSGKVLVISKPEGRRLCPICDNDNWFKIHESIDKTDIISHYPRIYGKLYTCSGCGISWKEK